MTMERAQAHVRHAQIARRVTLSHAHTLASSGKSERSFRTSCLTRGRIATVTTREVGCDGLSVLQHAMSRADEQYGQDGEVVWFWHPGADAPRNASALSRMR
jgi:hypothetical protein